MCGIAGFVLKNLECVYDPQRHLKMMMDKLFHRGPDKEKVERAPVRQTTVALPPVECADVSGVAGSLIEH